MTFQRCGRLEQLLTEYCNHYVSICRDLSFRRPSPSLSLSPSFVFAVLVPVLKKMIRVQRDNRAALEIENHSRNAANQTVFTVKLDSSRPQIGTTTTASTNLSVIVFYLLLLFFFYYRFGRRWLDLFRDFGTRMTVGIGAVDCK